MTQRDSSQRTAELFLDTLFATTPLLFVQEFLRDHKRKHKGIRIGSTVREARAALLLALQSEILTIDGLDEWLRNVEGWGKQHLYLARVRKRSLSHPHLLNDATLKRFLLKKALLADSDSPEGIPKHALTDISVDDELARLTWRVHGADWERREELDEERVLEDGVYQFRAYRRLLRRSASRVLIRKTDGVVLLLLDIPLGPDHDELLTRLRDAALAVLAPLSLDAVDLGPIVETLDSNALAGFGPRARRDLDMGVEPTLARYRTEGARVEFKSTRESTGYARSDAVRHVRRAMEVRQFVGEAGKFRLTFESDERRHDMVVSFHVAEHRAYLFSRMDEREVLTLTDSLLTLRR